MCLIYFRLDHLTIYIIICEMFFRIISCAVCIYLLFFSLFALAQEPPELTECIYHISAYCFYPLMIRIVFEINFQ